MQLKFTRSDISMKADSQIDEEPYDGFFKEKGIVNSTDLWQCDFGSWFAERFDANSSFVRDNSLTIIFPVIDAGHFLYANQRDKMISTTVKRPKKSVFIRTPIYWNKKILAGCDEKTVVQQTLDVLAKAGCHNWVGYITRAYTSSHHQTVVIDDDLQTSREKNECFVFYARQKALEVYGKLSGNKIKEFISSMPEKSQELCDTAQKAFRDAFEICEGWSEKDADEVSDEECSAIEKKLNGPIDAWFADYELSLKNVGITAAEDELAKIIAHYGVQKKLKVYDAGKDLRRTAFDICIWNMVF